MLARRLASITASLLFTGLAAAAGPVNIDGDGLALEGHDPVAFHIAAQAVQGDPSITAVHDGATYRFTTVENRARFVKDPARYLPAYGGYCAYGVARGAFAPVQISTWQIVDGRLYLNKNASIKKLFDQDRKGHIAAADRNWPGLVAARTAGE